MVKRIVAGLAVVGVVLLAPTGAYGSGCPRGERACHSYYPAPSSTPSTPTPSSPTPSSPTPSSSAVSSPPASPSPQVSRPPAGHRLPNTGPSGTGIAVALAALVMGALAVFYGRRRRVGGADTGAQ